MFMATLAQDSVQNVLQVVSDLRGETSTNTDAVRIRAVSRAERDFARRRFWRTHLLVGQTTTGDGLATSFTVGSTLYPMRFKGLVSLFVDGTDIQNRYDLVDSPTFQTRYNADHTDQIAYEWYDAANDAWKVRINPIVPNGDVITYSYYWEPPKRTSTSDVVVCPNMDILARLAMAYIYEGEDEPDKAQDNFRLAEQLIDEAAGTEDAPAIGTLIAMDAIENDGKQRGVGTY